MLGQQRKRPLSTMGSHAGQKSLPCSFPIRERDVALEDTWADVHNGQGHSSGLVAHHVQRQDWHIILQPGIQHAVQHLPAHHPYTWSTNAHHIERLAFWPRLGCHQGDEHRVCGTAIKATFALCCQACDNVKGLLLVHRAASVSILSVHRHKGASLRRCVRHIQV